MVRTRFSPSPTGYLHIGGVRTTLFSALYAAKEQGTFILRIEDTDALRSKVIYAEAQQADLSWLGIHWQEGPAVGGPYGPYWQSERQAIYATYYDLLAEQQLMYPCFCSEQELMLARKIQLSRGKAPRYQGTCRQLSQEAIAEKIAAGKKPAYRFIVPTNKTITFTDLVKGEQQFAAQDIGDFIIRRADETAPFLFCNAIDDALMKVSHVLRGEDHLSNTPRQLMLLNALNLSPPKYGHLSLIVGTDGAKLSKRHGDFSVREIRAQGYLPLAILNYLARLGHGLEAPQLLNFQELGALFNIDTLSRSPARFDTAQLQYFQKMAVQALTQQEVWQWLGKELESAVPESARTLFAETIKMNIILPLEALHWIKIFFAEHFLYDDFAKNSIREAGAAFFQVANEAANEFVLDLPQILATLKQKLQVNGKKLFMPLRLALTGQKDGPELLHVVQLLGKEKLVSRLNAALAIARNAL